MPSPRFGCDGELGCDGGTRRVAEIEAAEAAIPNTTATGYI
ncbi:MAG: hypothetical protein WCO23_05315 [bacterium]